MIDIQNAKLAKIRRANTDWWIHEQAMVGTNGKTYIAYCTDMGEIHVKEIDAKCSLTPSRDVCLCRVNGNFADEHNAPSICVTEAGHIIVAYTAHATTHRIAYRITERPFDIFSFGSEQELIYEESVTYVQLSENTARGELWLFTRVNSVTWEFRFSTDGGYTWSMPHKYLLSDAGGLFYFDIRKQYVSIHCGEVQEQWFFALYGHPLISADHTIRSGIFDSEGYLLTMDGERTDVNLYQGGILNLDDLAKVYESPEGTTVRLLSVAPTLPHRVGIATFTINRSETITYHSATYHDGKWYLSAPIANGGEFLAPDQFDGSQTYVGGMAYYYGVGEAGLHVTDKDHQAPTNRLYIARFNGAERVLESYLSMDNGKTYELEQLLRRISAPDVKIWRPTVPVYAQDNLPLYWHEGTYRAHTGGWHCDTVMYIEYDD